MNGPIQYNPNVINPGRHVADYLGNVTNRFNNAMKQRQEAQRKAQFREEFFKLGPDASGAEYNQIMMKFPEFVAQIDQAAKRMKLQNREADKSRFLQAQMAIQSGRPELASEIFSEMAEATMGEDPAMGEAYKNFSKDMMKQDGGRNLKTLNMVGARVFGDDYFKTQERQAGLEKLQMETGKIPAELAVKAEELNLKMRQAGELPQPSAKIVNDSSNEALDSYKLAVDSEALSKEIERDLESYGLIGKTLAEARKIAGWQTKEDLIRARFARLRNKGAIGDLPPGVASETDIKLVMQGYPDENANPDVLSTFLNVMAKAERYEGAKAEARSEWVANNRNAGPLKEDAEIMGLKVPKGTTYVDFVQNYGSELAKSQGIADSDSASTGSPMDAPDWYKAGGTPGYFGKY